MSDRVQVLSHLPLQLLGPVSASLPEVELIRIPQQGEIPPQARGEVLLTQTWGAPNLADAVGRGVRWIHAFGTGIDRFPFDAISDQALTCSRGASAIPIAEWVMAVMLAFEKQLPARWIHEPPEHWNMADLGGLHGRTLGLVGIGGIGQMVARRALAFGMRVRAFRRTDAPSPVAGVEVVTSLPALLAAADHVVVAAPSTPATRHLIDAEALGHLRPHAHLVNIARGDLVDQDALRAALDAGGLALASLDVCTPEPLPEGHWLYRHDKVRLSAHISWSMPGALDRLIEPFVVNLRHWIAGEPLEDRVDVEQGY